jgi:hypothetical protein
VQLRYVGAGWYVSQASKLTLQHLGNSSVLAEMLCTKPICWLSYCGHMIIHTQPPT